MYVGGKEFESEPDRHKFAVDTQFAAPVGPHQSVIAHCGVDMLLCCQGSVELGVWEDVEGEAGGWEGEMGREEGALMVASREAVAQQRREEREKRRKLQEALRCACAAAIITAVHMS